MTGPPIDKTVERLQKALEKVPQLRKLSTSDPVFRRWRRYTEKAIAKAYGEEDAAVKEFTEISFSPPHPLDYAFAEALRGSGVPRLSNQEALAIGLSKASDLLKLMVAEIGDFWDEGDQVKHSSGPKKEGQIDSKKIFLVHGRDDGPKHEVARFVEELDLVPVILDEQADRGRTIIAKFEEEAEKVGYAVVLLTPDDEARLRNSGNEFRLRARQNVIFELGFFAGKLGRRRVCAVIKGDLEKPSDYDGVVYIRFDKTDGWKLKLLRELKAAGFDVDANLVV